MLEIKKGSCHYKTCGIYSHHQRRTVPEQFGYNVACRDDQNAFAGLEIGLVDEKR